MEIFLNDCSFHEQYHERDEFEKSIRVLVGMLTLLQKIPQYTLYREPHLPYRAFRNEVITASVNRLRDQSLTRLLFEILTRIAPADWKENPVHSANDAFRCENVDVTNTSLAELAERKLRRTELVAALINFPNSRYQKKLHLDVLKNNVDTSRLSCVENKSEFATWLKDSAGLGSASYDYNSLQPPPDAETILNDPTRFQPTSLFQQGRRVHREIHTRHYWYVDNFHCGHGAHLEVFDSRGIHVGESDLEGEVDSSKKDPQKTIDM
jgi:hypothetical protein